MLRNIKQLIGFNLPAKNGEYDPTTPLAHEFEEQLAVHHERSKFWRQGS